MRSLWSGSLAFGLVNIPVQLYSASKDRALHFKMLGKHGLCPISYVRVCRETGKEVPYEDIVRGYEYQKGDYVVLSDKDFEQASPRKTKTIDIVQFSDAKEIDPRYYEKPYWIEPDKKAEKAYVLLREALKRAKKAAIATYVLRDHENMGAIIPEGDALMLYQLRFDDELRPAEDLHIPGKTKYSERELSMALSFIRELEDHFDATKFKDDYAQALEKVIEEKKKGKTHHVSADEKGPRETDMRDLMRLLKASLEREKAKR